MIFKEFNICYVMLHVKLGINKFNQGTMYVNREDQTDIYIIFFVCPPPPIMLFLAHEKPKLKGMCPLKKKMCLCLFLFKNITKIN